MISQIVAIVSIFAGKQVVEYLFDFGGLYMFTTEKCKSERFEKRIKILILSFYHPAFHAWCSGTREPARHLSNDEDRSRRDCPADHTAPLPR